MRNEECKEERKYQIESENKNCKSLVIGTKGRDEVEKMEDTWKSQSFSNKIPKRIESEDCVEKGKEDSRDKVSKDETSRNEDNEEIKGNINEKENTDNEQERKENCDTKDKVNVIDNNVKGSVVKEHKKKEDATEDQEEKNKNVIKEGEMLNNKAEDERKAVVINKEEKEEAVDDKEKEKKDTTTDREEEKNEMKILQYKEENIIAEEKNVTPKDEHVIEFDSPEKEKNNAVNMICANKENNGVINIASPINETQQSLQHKSITKEDKQDTTNKDENKVIILDSPPTKKPNDIIILNSPNAQPDKQVLILKSPSGEENQNTLILNSPPPHKENNQLLVLDSPPIQSKTFSETNSSKDKHHQNTSNKLNKTSIVDGSANKNSPKQNASIIQANPSATASNNNSHVLNEYKFIDLSAIEKQFEVQTDQNETVNNVKDNEPNNNNNNNNTSQNTSKLISPVSSSSKVYPQLNTSAFESIGPNTSTFHNINNNLANPNIQVATIPLINSCQITNPNTNEFKAQTTETNTNPLPSSTQEIKNQIPSVPEQSNPILFDNNNNNSKDNNNEVVSSNKINISKILKEHYFPEPKAADINYLQNQIPPPGISNLNSTNNVLNFYINLMDNVDEVASSSPPTTFNYYQIKEISEVSDLVGSHKLYEISYINSKTAKREIKCFRRYDNFFQFHQKVKKKYPTIIIPKIPPKNPLAKLIKIQDSFFEKRRLQLIFYLNFICKHPGLNKTKELFKFLTDAEFDINYFKVTQDDEPIPPSSLSTSETIKNTFYLMWNSISTGTKARYIPNEENLLKKYETHFQSILKRYQDVQCSITEYLQSVTKECKEYENMSSVFDFLKESFVNVNNSKQNLIKYSKHCEAVSKINYEEAMSIEKLDNKLNAVISLNEGICDSLKNYCSFVERFESVLKLKEIAMKNKWDKIDVILNEYDACLNHKGMLEKSLVKDTSDYIKLFDDFTSQIFDEFKLILIKINNKTTEEDK